MRSSTPPCPGRSQPESWAPKARFKQRLAEVTELGQEPGHERKQDDLSPRQHRQQEHLDDSAGQDVPANRAGRPLEGFLGADRRYERMLSEEPPDEVPARVAPHRHGEHEEHPFGAAVGWIDAQPDEMRNECARIERTDEHVTEARHGSCRVIADDQAADQADRHHGHKAGHHHHRAFRRIAGHADREQRSGDDAQPPQRRPRRERHLKVLDQRDQREE